MRVLCGFRTRAPEEDDAENANEACRRERGRQGEQRADRRHQKLQSPLRQLRAQQDRLKGEPFRSEAVQRRQRCDRGAGDQEQEAGPRHFVNQPAKAIHLTLAGRGQHGAGAEKQDALEQGMVEDVEQRGGQREGGGGEEAVGLESEARGRGPTKIRPMFSIVL